jgi:hypothetical protein
MMIERHLRVSFFYVVTFLGFNTMLMKIRLLVLALLMMQYVCAIPPIALRSPDGQFQLLFSINEQQQPTMQLQRGSQVVLHPSTLGLDISDMGGSILTDSTTRYRILSQQTDVHNSSWEPVWGEVKSIVNQYQSLLVRLEGITGNRTTQMEVEFRLFNDGMGFRYRLPAQQGLDYVIVQQERTRYALTGDHTAWWIPGDYDSNEYRTTTSKLSEVDARVLLSYTSITAKNFVHRYLIQQPLLLKTAEGLYISLHEAALVNYPAMNVQYDPSSQTLTSMLVPDALGNKAYWRTPTHTPWRTCIVSNMPTDLLASNTILNLNEPATTGDYSWIKPQKFVGVWWEMHVNKSTWERASGRHGANTANVKRYIDFAARHNIPSVLVEGWNTGWEDWYGKWKEDVFDFITPYPDFDLPELAKYAQIRGVKLVMHHETSGAVSSYERQMDTAYRLMKNYGYDAVKTGYVGRIIPRGEHHDGQWMVNHFNRVLQKTGSYRIMVDAHEPVRPTGLHRTFPHLMACESARGMEFNAWSEGNLPEHETILPFTRLMGGPMDFTPGIFQLDLSLGDSTRNAYRVRSTLAKQLALYVTIYSPFQMVPDLPEHYEKYPDAFKFIRDVAVDWTDSRYLEAEPGDYITVVRQAKGTGDWFLGAITDEQARKTTIKFDFLEPGTRYMAEMYVDAPDAHWEKNPQAYRVGSQVVTQKSVLNLTLAAGGGTAIRFRKL